MLCECERSLATCNRNERHYYPCEEHLSASPHNEKSEKQQSGFTQCLLVIPKHES